MAKFDVAIMNPPYDKNLHLKILEKVFPKCDEVVNISPIDSFVDINMENSISKRLSHYADELEYFSEKESNELFGIYNSCKLGITKFKENAKGISANFEELRNVIYKLRKQKSIRSSLNYQNDGHFTMIQGDYGYAKSWHYTLEQLFNGKNVKATIGFETEEELDNFKNITINRWPYKLMYIVDNKSAVIAHLPFIGKEKNPSNGKIGYTTSWTNKDFCDYFDITGFISDTEAEPNSEWEEILKTMEKYE